MATKITGKEQTQSPLPSAFFKFYFKYMTGGSNGLIMQPPRWQTHLPGQRELPRRGSPLQRGAARGARQREPGLASGPAVPLPRRWRWEGAASSAAPRSLLGEGRWGAESETDREWVTFYFPLLVKNGERQLKYVPGAKELNFAHPPHQLYHKPGDGAFEVLLPNLANK